MKGIPRGRYSKEFREEAIKLVTDEKLSLPEAGRPRPFMVEDVGSLRE